MSSISNTSPLRSGPAPTRRIDVPRQRGRALCLRNVCWLAFAALLPWIASACAHADPGAPIRDAGTIDTDRLEKLLWNPIPFETKESYRIGEGDVLTVYLIGRPDVLGEKDNRKGAVGEEGFVVTENPYLIFPKIGPVRVHGLTADQLQVELGLSYGLMIINPRPVVVIKKFRRNRIRVLGMVQNPGTYAWRHGDKVIDAIIKAGGVNPERRHVQQSPGRYIKIFRETAHATHVDNEPANGHRTDSLPGEIAGIELALREEITVPIREYLRSGRLRYNIPLYANDIIYLPPAGSVIVKGTVLRPGVGYLGPSVQTVTDVITERGGLRFSAKSNIDVVRLTDSSEPQIFRLDIRDMLARRKPDFFVEDGDQIVVYRSRPRAVAGWFLEIFHGGSKAGFSATVGPGL